jgi:hypothetical protein
MAILRVELEEVDRERVLIRIRIVDDVVEPGEPRERAFASTALAVDHLRAWLDGWVNER